MAESELWWRILFGVLIVGVLVPVAVMLWRIVLTECV